MFSTWDIVRPTMWHPMSMLEQSMMDLDMMANQMLGSRFPMSETMLTAPSNQEDDEFFKDLPVAERGEKVAEKQPEGEQEGTRAFSSYSFSNSSVVDDQGRRILSTRRRYEDSNGRLKAVHEREMDGKRMKTIWNRKDKDDVGEHHTVCSDGTAEEFEKMWCQTPFGLAQEKKGKEIKAQGEEPTSGGKTASSQTTQQSEAMQA
ncbi:hypothetical protein Poli38472_010079 [Pythium oligandrum]|uniref:Myeloid leukemia factor n=1 Tax=Pythium oligandrum TaxID=41045 RepID=A0A8K1C917_PYTOL|nr:hypothetical protein Poli38472_010079 [Pythium oligandrum]|eukprot:TMW58520.1 hypothetical protein Poli38472_010079 [Pythium oligandrum]